MVLALQASVRAQRLIEREEEFLQASPLVGDQIPKAEVFNADGSPFRTSELKGHYTVLTFGCLTCPPSMWNIAELETVNHDYKEKGVQFYFIYKSLAHPELAGDYIQPFTLEERLAHASQAKNQLGTNIPWVVDAMDNRLKRALGDRPNSQFIIDPNGRIVVKRAWSNPKLVREELAGYVGPSVNRTTIEDLNLTYGSPLKLSAPHSDSPRINRENMMAIICKPVIEESTAPFFAKLRVEVERKVLQGAAGKIYLGFQLDPIHDAHWNNLNDPLEFTLSGLEGVKIEPTTATTVQSSLATDSDPREFLLEVKEWPSAAPVTLSVKYYACTPDGSCHAVAQKYRIELERDIDGGSAKGRGPGLWAEKEFSTRLLDGDRNGDQKISTSEAAGIIQPHFDKLDSNYDGQLDRSELGIVTRWLNEIHRPDPPASNELPKETQAD